jgi:hypothetical protein
MRLRRHPRFWFSRREAEMILRHWTGPRRDPWRRSPVERLREFVIVWIVPIAVILMLAFFAAAHP